MWEWTIKRAVQFSRSVMSDSECWRIDAFELGSWRRLLRVPWTARRSNQIILKEMNREYSLEGLMKFQYFGYLMWRADSSEMTLMLGKIEGKRRRGWQRMRRLDGNIDLVSMNLSKPWEIVKDREIWRASFHRVTKNQTCLSNWTTALWTFVVVSSHPTHKYLYVYWVSTSTSHSAKIH